MAKSRSIETKMSLFALLSYFILFFGVKSLLHCPYVKKRWEQLYVVSKSDLEEQDLPEN